MAPPLGPNQQRIFDGCNSVTVEKCCSGVVFRRDIEEARAWSNMVAVPQLVEAVLFCKDCGKVLHTIKANERANSETTGPTV